MLSRCSRDYARTMEGWWLIVKSLHSTKGSMGAKVRAQIAPTALVRQVCKYPWQQPGWVGGHPERAPLFCSAGGSLLVVNFLSHWPAFQRCRLATRAVTQTSLPSGPAQLELCYPSSTHTGYQLEQPEAIAPDMSEALLPALL